MQNLPARPPGLAALALGLGLALGLALVPCVTAQAAGTDRYRVDLSVAWQVERFHSRAADSLGLSLTRGVTTELGFDFRVLDAPMPGAAKPAIHVFGHVAKSNRAFGPRALAVTGLPDEVIEAPLIEMGGGVALHVPMDLVDRGAGAALVVSYEGALLSATRTDYDLMRIKRIAFGFERTRGFFEGSLAELGYGRNELFGEGFAAKRWSPHFRIQCRLVGTPKAGAAAPATATPPDRTRESLAHAFVDLVVDTDNRPGPDGIQGRFGLTIDSGAILRALLGGSE